MKRLISLILSMVILLLLFDSGTISSTKTEILNNLKDKEELLNGAVAEFYSNRDLSNNGKLQIYKTKTLDDNYIVLAEKYSGDGHRFLHLFLLDKDYNIKAWTSGETPISNCFSANSLDYCGNRIVFGSFNDTKWDSEKDRKLTVKIDNIYLKLDNNQEVIEEVSKQKGYILILDSISKVEKVQLYNDKGELQGSLDDGINIIYTQFNEI